MHRACPAVGVEYRREVEAARKGVGENSNGTIRTRTGPGGGGGAVKSKVDDRCIGEHERACDLLGASRGGAGGMFEVAVE